MGNFGFWQKWLFGVGIYVAIFGFVMALFSGSFVFEPLHNRVNLVFFAEGEMPENFLKFQTFFYGVLGATMGGWGIFIAYVAKYPFNKREKWAWNCMAVGTVAWYSFDTGISYYCGVTANVILNTVFLFFLGAPLLFTRKEF